MDSQIKTPTITKTLVDYLDETFDIDKVIYNLNREGSVNNDERFGFINGVRGVINHLKGLRQEQQEEKLEANL